MDKERAHINHKVIVTLLEVDYKKVVIKEICPNKAKGKLCF